MTDTFVDGIDFGGFSRLVGPGNLLFCVTARGFFNCQNIA